jgi:hypothetical protein
MTWRISDFPELAHLDPDQRARVLARVPSWTYPIIIARAGLVGAIAGLLAGGLTTASTRPDLATIVGLALAIVVGLRTYLWQMDGLRTTMRRTIAEGFSGQRLPFCFECGYDLRGSKNLQCPECGRPTRDAPS